MSSAPHPADSAPPHAPRRVLRIGMGSAAVVALVLGGGALAQALFTSQATVSGQNVTTATVAIEAGVADTSAPISVSDLLPGDTVSTTITLDNTGSSDIFYTLALPLTTGDAALTDVLVVAVTVGSATETRTLTSWQSGKLRVGPSLAAGASQTVTVSALLPSTAGNSVQATAANFGIQFDAVQARNTTPPVAGWIAN